MKKLILLCSGGINQCSHVNMYLENKKDINISNRLIPIKPFVTNYFCRKPRGLNVHRFFLLYSGPKYLKGILREECNLHFMRLYVAFRIFSSLNNTEKYLKTYINRCFYLIMFIV